VGLGSEDDDSCDPKKYALNENLHSGCSGCGIDDRKSPWFFFGSVGVHLFFPRNFGQSELAFILLMWQPYMHADGQNWPPITEQKGISESNRT